MTKRLDSGFADKQLKSCFLAYKMSGGSRSIYTWKDAPPSPWGPPALLAVSAEGPVDEKA